MKKDKQNKAPSPTLDLHGLTRDEVWAKLDQFIMRNQHQARLRVMTGKGKGIVQEETFKYLKQAGYHYSFERLDNGKLNEGVLVVFMQ